MRPLLLPGFLVPGLVLTGVLGAGGLSNAHTLYAQAVTEQRGAAMHEVSGSFEVTMSPLPGRAAEAISSYRFAKTYHGALTATATGQMLSAGEPKTGNAGYVAIEQVTGELDGRKGSFALLHKGILHVGRAPELSVEIIPGSGAGELAGIEGTLTIAIAAGGAHSYTLRYEFAGK